MCWKLEFDRHSKQAKNRLPKGRLALNITGILLILAIGAVAAVIAVKAKVWFPVFKYNDGVYLRLTKSDNRVVNMTKAAAKDCTNTNEALKMVGRLVFRCGKEDISNCIPMDYRCDGYTECDDKSDEIDCGKICKSNVRFHCNTLQEVEGEDEEQPADSCFHTNYKCDGEIDCTGENIRHDESECGDTFTIGATGVKCGIQNNWICKDGNQCIVSSNRCDGYENCWDGSDEENC